MTYIVGHVSPDWDCIAALWLLQRFDVFADAEIKMVNTSNPDPAILAGAAAVVDTGRIYDKYNHRFDHHQFPGAAASETCAAHQVWMHLTHVLGLGYLEPLIDLIHAGDSGKPRANESRRTGIHALLAARKAARWSDKQLLVWGFQELDFLAAGLLARQEARETLDTHMVYRSPDGLLVALSCAPRGATQAAFDSGAQLVVWHNPMPDVPTVAVGMNRAPESGTDCGMLVGRAMDADVDATYARMYGEHPFDVQPSPLWDELDSWYRHASGFFVGRGTEKAPNPRPLSVSLADIAAALDAAWRR